METEEKVMMGWRRLVMKGPAERSLLLTTRFGGRELGEVIPPHPTQGGRDTDPSKGLPLFLGNASFDNSKSSSCQWHSQFTHVKLEPICVFGQNLGSFCLPGPNNKKVPQLWAIMAPHLTSAITLECTLYARYNQSPNIH